MNANRMAMQRYECCSKDDSTHLAGIWTDQEPPCFHGPRSHVEIHKDVYDPEHHLQHLQEVSSCTSVWVSACEIDGWWAVDLRTNKQETKSEWSLKWGFFYLMQLLQSLCGGRFKWKTKTGILKIVHICIEYMHRIFLWSKVKNICHLLRPHWRRKV